MTEPGITPKQISEFIYNLEQEPDWWSALFWKHMTPESESLEALCERALNQPESWAQTVQEAKADGMRILRELPLAKPAQWNLRVQLLLAHPVQVALLQLHLKSLVQLKTKKVTDIGTRAQIRQRINTITSMVAKDALDALERYSYGVERLAQCASGSDTKPGLKAYYEARTSEGAHGIAKLLGFLFLFKAAASAEDIRRLQRYIDEQFLLPFRAQSVSLTNPEEIKTLREKTGAYESLRRAIEINFE